jgi:hypothetical protein
MPSCYVVDACITAQLYGVSNAANVSSTGAYRTWKTYCLEQCLARIEDVAENSFQALDHYITTQVSVLHVHVHSQL